MLAPLRATVLMLTCPRLPQLPPPGGVSWLPSVISLLSVSATRMPRVHVQAPPPTRLLKVSLRGLATRSLHGARRSSHNKISPSWTQA